MLYKYTHVLDRIKYFFTMRLRTYHKYNKYIEYVKSTGISIVVVGLVLFTGFFSKIINLLIY